MAATATALTSTAFFCLGTYTISSVVLILNGQREPMVLWINPFYALTVLQNLFARDYQAEQNISIVWFYFLVMPTLTAAILLFMLRRYRQAVRG